MKILQIVSTPPFAWAAGGCARVVHDLSRELAKNGHEVTLLTTDLYTPRERYPEEKGTESIEGVKIIRFKNISNSLAWKNKFFFAPGLVRYLRKRTKKFHIVHLQDLISFHAVVTCHYCNKFGIPYVLTTHGSIPWLNDNAMLNKLYRILFGKRILFNASKIFVLNSSEFSLCKHMGIPEDKLQVIPNGINLSDYQNLPNNGKFRLKHSINTDVPIILYVGRIYKKKGLDLLVQAFSLVLKDIPEARLVLIGPDDGYQHYLIELSETLQIYDKLIFCGFLSHNDKMEAFVDSDVFVTPKFYGFPITFIEACICGKPIVTTNEGDWLDWIHRHTGCCIDYNIQSLKQAIIFIIKNDKISKEFGENGKKIVNNYFNWEKIVKKVEIVYTKIKR